MKKCNFKKEDLLAYYYAELSPEEMTEVREHLAVCKDCLSEINSMGKILSLMKRQRLKKIPPEILASYTGEIKKKIEESKVGFVSILEQRFQNWWRTFRYSIFSPRLIPATVTIFASILIFMLVYRIEHRPVNLISQDIALFDELGEDIEKIFLEEDEDGLAEEIKMLDTVMFAQEESVKEDVEEILEELEMLEELGEEDINDTLENLKLLDELELESSSVG
jgi:hypothetical protein